MAEISQKQGESEKKWWNNKEGKKL